MPRVSTFHGISIWVYYDDHPPLHFHATFGEHVAQLTIDGADVVAGSLPARALRLVREWATLHRDELVAVWAKARTHQPLGTIEPLP